MKKIRIFYSSYFQDNPDRIAELEGPDIDVDFSVLTEHYRTLGKNNLKYLEKFIPLWEREWEPELFDPKARIVLLENKNVERSFGEEINYGDADTDFTALMVWTVGEGIEKKSAKLMSLRGDLMSGFLLDVAGSIALYDMHRVLLEWVSDKVQREHSKFVSAELYPGFQNTLQLIMDKIEITGKTEETIGVKAQSNLMLKPRKTQCSFVGFGNESVALSSSVMKCNPCSGKRCLYYQLGGCHMDVLAVKGYDVKSDA
ncbi:MAG: hypothetical protein GX672_02590 [Synergistaceae bacterium]|nr:hypothetical protein [Synergistaceae bacterium]